MIAAEVLRVLAESPAPSPEPTSNILELPLVWADLINGASEYGQPPPEHHWYDGPLKVLGFLVFCFLVWFFRDGPDRRRR